jgi:hypothetical protein
VTTLTYDGKQYQLIPIETRVPHEAACEKCDLNYELCSDADPDWLCFNEAGEGKVHVFKEVTNV